MNLSAASANGPGACSCRKWPAPLDGDVLLALRPRHSLLKTAYAHQR